jgi:hypothetical protein
MTPTSNALRTVLLLACGLSVRCATVSSGPMETIRLSSEPSGADVSVDCGSGTTGHVTPAEITIPRRAPDCTLTFRKAGFERESVLVAKGINARTWLNVPIAAIGVTMLGVSGFSNDPTQARSLGAGFLVAGLGGLALDALNGRFRDHDPKTVRVILRPSAQAGAGIRYPGDGRKHLRGHS